MGDNRGKMKVIRAEIKKATHNPRFYGGILISWALAGLVVAQAWRDPLSFYLGKITLSLSLLYPMALFGPVGGIWGGTENIAEERMEGTLSTALLRPLSRWEWYWGKVGFSLFYNLLMVFTPLLGMALLDKIMWGGGVSLRLLGGGAMVVLYISSFSALSYLFSSLFYRPWGGPLWALGVGAFSWIVERLGGGESIQLYLLTHHFSSFNAFFLPQIDWWGVATSLLVLGSYTGGAFFLGALIFARQEER